MAYLTGLNGVPLSGVGGGGGSNSSGNSMSAVKSGSGAPVGDGDFDGQIWIDTDPTSPTSGSIWFWSVTLNDWIKELA